MQLQFQIFPNYLFMQLQFFFPELILHKYSVGGYVRIGEVLPVSEWQHVYLFAAGFQHELKRELILQHSDMPEMLISRRLSSRPNEISVQTCSRQFGNSDVAHV